MTLTLELERQSESLIEQARIVLAEALRLDPPRGLVDEAQLIARLEAVREAANRLRIMTTGVRLNAVRQRSAARRKAVA